MASIVSSERVGPLMATQLMAADNEVNSVNPDVGSHAQQITRPVRSHPPPPTLTPTTTSVMINAPTSIKQQVAYLMYKHSMSLLRWVLRVTQSLRPPITTNPLSVLLRLLTAGREYIRVQAEQKHWILFNITLEPCSPLLTVFHIHKPYCKPPALL